MASPEAAKAALRTSQNSVLGRGKRARGVTVTRSNQEELMRAVRPALSRACGCLLTTPDVLTAIPILARELRRRQAVSGGLGARARHHHSAARSHL